MKILKQRSHLFILLSVIILVGLFVISDLTAADTRDIPVSIVSDSGEKKTGTKNESRVEKDVTVESSISTETQKLLKTYFHKELDYSFQYPKDWLLATYPSNGYQAIGLWDPVAQAQKTEGHLRQGAKIEIAVCDCVPPSTLKDFLTSQSEITPEKRTGVEEVDLDLYKDNTTVSVVRSDYTTEHGGGKSVHFIDRDGKWYRTSLIIPNLATLESDQLQEYETVFESIIQSLNFH